VHLCRAVPWRYKQVATFVALLSPDASMRSKPSISHISITTESIRTEITPEAPYCAVLLFPPKIDDTILLFLSVTS
jgi:hypothetical protein